MRNHSPILRIVCAFFVVMILLVGVMPAQAASFASQPQANGSLGWAKNLGGVQGEYAEDLALDSLGNVYTLGTFEGTADFNPGAGVVNLTSAGSLDVFISKLDGAGNYVWAKRIGGASQDSALGIALDSSNNVYIVGTFWGTADFDPGAGTANLVSAGNTDVFICKLNSNGVFVWAKRIGAAGYDNGREIALDSTGNVYITGVFSNTVDFDPGAATVNLTSAGSGDVFISKLDASGNYVWAKRMGGTGADGPDGIAVDSANNVYTTGVYEGTVDFDPGAGVANLTNVSVGFDDTFISKLNGSGNFVWAKSMGGAENDHPNQIKVDSGGNVYTVGRFSATADFDPGAGIANLTSAGFDDLFISKLNVGGNFVWAKRIGDIGYDEAKGIALDSAGNIYITGTFDNTVDFDPGANTFNLTTAGVADIFVSKLDGAGTFVWAKSMGGTDYDRGESIALSKTGGLFIAGAFLNVADFDPGAATFNLTSAGGADAFVAKIDNTVSVTLQSIAAHDGFVLESAENSNAGGTVNNASLNFNVGDDAAKKQLLGILSFNTGASLPDNAVITAVVLKVKQQSIAGGGNPVTAFQGFMVDVKNGFLGTFPALQPVDFQAAADKTVGPFSPAPAASVYSINLTGAQAFVNKAAANSGLTQIRLRFTLDDNNNAVANNLVLFSGDASAADRPQLVINYYVP